jgi:hypothetical protein
MVVACSHWQKTVPQIGDAVGTPEAAACDALNNPDLIPTSEVALVWLMILSALGVYAVVWWSAKLVTLACERLAHLIHRMAGIRWRM